MSKERAIQLKRGAVAIMRAANIFRKTSTHIEDITTRMRQSNSWTKETLMCLTRDLESSITQAQTHIEKWKWIQSTLDIDDMTEEELDTIAKKELEEIQQLNDRLCSERGQ
jgi:hypothetical protein